MTSTQAVDFVEPGFERVASAFFATIGNGSRSGASVSIWRDGRPIVELAAGTASATEETPFVHDTLIPIASVTKGLAALVIARLVERGDLPGYETPIVEIWPEFAAHGKGRVSLGGVLAHRAGVSAPREDLSPTTVLDSIATADALARQEPLWTPDASHQYHAFTHGALTAKLVSVADRRSLGAVFAEEIAGPLGAEAWIGLPAEHDARVAPLVPESGVVQVAESSTAPRDIWIERSMTLGASIDVVSLVYSPEGRRAELPGVNGIATASGVARIWSSAVTATQGVRIISDRTADELRAVRSRGVSAFGGPPPYQSWGAGVMTPSHWEPYLSEYSFGHDGSHGQVSFGDLHHRIGFAYLTNQMGDWRRGQSVIAALADSLH